MKNIILIFVIGLILTSCTSNQCVETYMNAEAQKNKKDNIKSILYYGKENNYSKVLDIYSDNSIVEHNKKICAIYNQKDYEYFLSKYTNSKKEYWNKKNQTKFSFDSISYNFNNLRSFTNDGKLIKKYYYIISNPIFFKNKKTVMFYCYSFEDTLNPVEELLVIMKKIKGKWIVVEKVHSQTNT
jgi:hypothetical protein